MFVSRKPIFPGTSTMNQLDRIMEVTGKPANEDIVAVQSPFAVTMLESLPPPKPKKTPELFPRASHQAADLLQKLLQFNPEKRITAEEALRHPYLAQFHNPADEPLCDHRILIPVDDNIKYSVQEYREKLYSEIVQRKKVCHRIPSLPLFSHRFRFRSCVEECASVSRLGQCNKDPVTYSRV